MFGFTFKEIIIDFGGVKLVMICLIVGE